jgi:hypothetical protein
MNLKNLKTNMAGQVHWVDGFGVEIGNDGIARNVPAEIGAKCLANPAVWREYSGEPGPQRGVVGRRPGLFASLRPAAPPPPALMPLSLDFLEKAGLQSPENLVVIARELEADITEAGTVTEAAHIILAAADRSFLGSLKHLLEPEEATPPEPKAPASTSVSVPPPADPVTLPPVGLVEPLPPPAPEVLAPVAPPVAPAAEPPPAEPPAKSSGGSKKRPVT